MRTTAPPPLASVPRRPTHSRNTSTNESLYGDEFQRNSNDHGGKKRKDRSHESLIIVRPPPSKMTHPLNLQVQLVSPSTKGKERARNSFDSSADVGDDIIAPTSSNSSQWDVSTTGHTSSVSLASGSSMFSPSSKRAITPLYNLQAHNMLTNVIVDASTDAKVAKFHKQGLEIIGLAILEPVEIWAGASFKSTSGRGVSLESEATSSATSLTSNTHVSHDAQHSMSGPSIRDPSHQPSQSSTDQTSTTGVRKFLGKMFKKKSTDIPAASGSRRPSLPSETQTQLSHPSSASARRTLGVTPHLESPVYPPRGKHPKSYTWVVRRWLKYDDSQTSLVEVRFEWKRAKAKGKGREEGLQRRTEDGSDKEISRERTATSAPPVFRQQLPLNPPVASPRRKSFEMDDPDEESDTEDSDTPWTCSLVCNRHTSTISTSPAHAAAQHKQPQETRLRVGSVIPAPHHPKITAMLKIPNPLPDIDLGNGTAHKRGVKSLGRPKESRPTTRSSPPSFPVYTRSAVGSLLSSLHDFSTPTIMTAQEIKDIVSCTGIWLIVREGFGGIGVERRKIVRN
ncbi:hypothetical protein QCA50_011832 [Cerrena zonata]|uniref:Uncharacterized protein n=1 Tax=Cerrena zonata TaxID=2478898 RepID=A0AAW0FXT0_9APHY